MDLDLTGKTAVVTGASAGIGAAAVRQLTDHGARVAFCARGADAVEALASEVEGSVGLTADMGHAASTDAFLAAAGEALGRIDILVNNVGASPSRNFLYMTDEDWADLHQLNVMSAGSPFLGV